MEIKTRKELWRLLPKLPVVAEIGVAEGLFSRDMIEWGLKKLYCVDIWQHSDKFFGDAGSEKEWHNQNRDDAFNRLSRFDNVEFMQGESVEMAKYIEDNSLDLCYIDACHSYECVVADIQAYKNKVKKGGIIAFHDFLNNDYGVQQAVREFAHREGYEVNIINENNWHDAGAWIRL